MKLRKEKLKAELSKLKDDRKCFFIWMGGVLECVTQFAESLES